MNFSEALAVAIISGIIGYFLGKLKEFRESKQKIYSSIMPMIVEMCFNPQLGKEKEYNSAILLSWLYSNKKVANQIDKIASIMIDPSRGEIIKEVQSLIVKMRKDIQPFFWSFLKEEQVAHIYTKFNKRYEHSKLGNFETIIDELIKATKNGEAYWIHNYFEDKILLELNGGDIVIEKVVYMAYQRIYFRIVITYKQMEYYNEHIEASDKLYTSISELFDTVKFDENLEYNDLLKAIKNRNFVKHNRKGNYESEGLPF